MQKALLNKLPVLALDIDTSTEDIIKEHGKNNELFCPYCGELLIFKSGTEKISHFAHKKANEDCLYSLIHTGDTGVFEEAQSNFLSKLRSQYPNINFDIAVKENDELIDIYGPSLGYEIKIKFFSNFEDMTKYKSKILKILISKTNRVTIPFQKLIDDIFVYCTEDNTLTYYRVENLPFGVFGSTCRLNEVSILDNNTISVKKL